MSVYPIARYVADPSTTARVLFDFQNPGSHDYPHTYLHRDDFDIGEPSLSGDYRAAGRVYGTRELKLRFKIRGRQSDTLRVLSALSRELLRPRSWFMFQLSEHTAPVFFPTYATDPGKLDFDRAHNDPTEPMEWNATLPLVADAFAQGSRITQPLKALGNDPASGGVVYELPPLFGDGPAPLTISAVPALSAGNWGARRLLMSLLAITPDAVDAGPVLWNAANFGVPFGSGTGAVTADGSWFGPGYREVTFADSALSIRLAPTAAPTPVQPLRPGRYMAFARVAVTNIDTVVDLQWGDTGKVVRFAPPAVAGFISWVPLGNFTTPRGVDLSAITIEDTAAARTGHLNAARVSGTGNLRINGVLFVPVDMPGAASVTTLITTSINRPTVVQHQHQWDTEHRALWRSATGGLMESVDTIEHGDYLVAVPGERNILTLLQQTQTEDFPFALPEMSDSLTHSTQLTVSYSPQYLWLAGDQ